MGWAATSARHPRGLVGPAGERVLRASLLSHELGGRYAVVATPTGEVSHLFGAKIAGGPMDAAAVHAATRGGVPIAPMTLAFEVKNLRHWIYPSAYELYQLLHKAALLTQANPHQLIAPVLVCRRRHYWTRQMAIDLGFFVIEVHRQFVLPTKDIAATEFEEVRHELGYETLVMSEDEDPRLIQTLRDALPQYAPDVADRWHSVGSVFVSHYQTLRDPTVRRRSRDVAMTKFREAVGMHPETIGDW